MSSRIMGLIFATLMLGVPAFAGAPATKVAVVTAPAGTTATERAAAVAAAGKLADEMDALAKTDELLALTRREQAIKALLPALREPAVHDAGAAKILARAVAGSKGFEMYTALALVEECLQDAPGDASLKEYAGKLKPLVDAGVYESFKKQREELKLMLVKARAGDVAAINAVGDGFARGDGTLTDQEQAQRYFAVAAAAGNAQALGSMGIYAPKDSEAIQWYEQAFAAGNYLFADKIAEIYTQRRQKMFVTHDVARDMEKGWLWYRLSFHAGVSKATAALAALSEDKNSGHYDTAAAVGYWRLAADQYDANARKLLTERKLARLDLGFNAVVSPAPKLQLGKEPDAVGMRVQMLGLTKAVEGKLQADDMITQVNGQEFNSEYEFRRLAYMSPDAKLTLALTRKGQKLTVTIVASENTGK